MEFIKINPESIDSLLSMMESFYTIDNYPFDKNISRENIVHFMNNDHLGEIYLIQSENGAVAGYFVLTTMFSFEYKGLGAYIDELYIVPEHRNMKLGGSAIQFIELRAKELNVKVLHLEVERHNEVGKSMYHKQGFSDTNRNLLVKELNALR